MAVPKKKSSKSRRNMRRYSTAYKLKPVTYVTSAVTGGITRPHRITKEMLESGRHLEQTANFKKRSAASSK